MSERIWTPDDHNEVRRASEMADKMITLKAEIVRAKFHPDEMTLIVVIRLPNGEMKTLPQHASCFRYHGKKYSETSKDEVQRELKKTEEMYNGVGRGKRFNLTLPEVTIGENRSIIE